MHMYIHICYQGTWFFQHVQIQAQNWAFGQNQAFVLKNKINGERECVTIS